jgi:hypothetical protein
VRECRVIRDFDSKDGNNKQRKHFSRIVYEIVVENSKYRKMLNRLNKIIKQL